MMESSFRGTVEWGNPKLIDVESTRGRRPDKNESMNARDKTEEGILNKRLNSGAE